MPGMNLKQGLRARLDGVLPRVAEFLLGRVVLPVCLSMVACVVVACTVFVMTLVVVLAPFAPRHADALFHKFMQEIGQ